MMPSGIAWSTGNRKLRKLRTIGFGIPAGVAADGFNTCPGKGLCSSICYARQGFYQFPWVAAALERNLAIVRRSLRAFENAAVDDLFEKGPDSVRVHDSGDFFDQAYLDTWYRIALRFQHITFYAFTKMFARLDLWSRQPANFRIVQSLGGLDDARVDYRHQHARIFVTAEDRIRAGYADGMKDDSAAIAGELRIGLVYHSANKPLPSGVRKALALYPPRGRDSESGAAIVAGGTTPDPGEGPLPPMLHDTFGEPVGGFKNAARRTS